MYPIFDIRTALALVLLLLAAAAAAQGEIAKYPDMAVNALACILVFSGTLLAVAAFVTPHKRALIPLACLGALGIWQITGFRITAVAIRAAIEGKDATAELAITSLERFYPLLPTNPFVIGMISPGDLVPETPMEFVMLFGPAYVVILFVFLWMRYALTTREDGTAPASGPGAVLTLAVFLVGTPLAGDMLNAFTIQSNIRAATNTIDRDAIRRGDAILAEFEHGGIVPRFTSLLKEVPEGSSRRSSSVVSLDAGTQVDVLSFARDDHGDAWLRVRDRAGKAEGHVSLDDVAAAPPGLKPPEPEVELREMAETRRALRNSNMRAAPGTHNPVVGRVDKGEEVLVIASARDRDGDLWYLAAPEDNQEPAFVYSELLVTDEAYAAANPKSWLCEVRDIYAGRYRDRRFRVTAVDRGTARRTIHSQIPSVKRIMCDMQ